jgi:hypothetical protein
MYYVKFLPVQPFLDEPAFFCDVLNRSSFGSLCRKAYNSEDVRLEKKNEKAFLIITLTHTESSADLD